MTEREREPRPLRLHILRWASILVVCGLLVHFLLPRLDSIEESLRTARTLTPWAIALAVVAEALSYVSNGGVLQSVVCLAGEKLSLRRAVAIEFGAGTVALVAAGALGFGAAIYKWTRSSGVSRDTAMLASWLPTVFDSTTLVLFALVSAFELMFEHQLSRTTMIALVVVVSILAALIATLIVLLARNDWMTKIAEKATRFLLRVRPSADPDVLLDASERAAHTWAMMGNGGWARPAASSLGVLAFDILCLKFVFIAAGEHLHLGLLVAGYGVPLLLGRASFLPGGIAIIEVAMAALYGGLGVPANIAVVVVLTWRLISFWIPTLVGIPIAVGFQSRRVSRTAQVQ
jgi:uncharacterized protein (TIRG00374 family)